MVGFYTCLGWPSGRVRQYVSRLWRASSIRGDDTLKGPGFLQISTNPAIRARRRQLYNVIVGCGSGAWSDRMRR